MPITKLPIADFLSQSKNGLVIDVRSPGEYNHAHIPGAYNLPLFTDEERKIVGTAYKQQSREAAIKIGLDFFGVKMKPMIEEVEKLFKYEPNRIENQKSKIIHLYCWRGGMRSTGVAWLLDLYGFKVFTLQGGYKIYRNWVLQTFETKYNFKIIGGRTGSAKTYIIQELNKSGAAAIDLEGMACHKGSAFGALGEKPQPTQEMFENQLAARLNPMSNLQSPIYLEDESQRIGHVNIPPSIFLQMREAQVLYCDIPFEERLRHILEGYSTFDIQQLKDATLRIQKRLGGLACKQAIALLDEGNVKEAFRILLEYYDREYDRGTAKRKPESIINLGLENCNPATAASIILEKSKELA